MMDFLRTYFKGDRVIWAVYASMIVMSSMIMYSASSSLAIKADHFYEPVWSHTLFLIAGAVVAFLVHRMSLRVILSLSPLLYLISLVLLILTPFIGRTVNGATRWISIPVVGILFQPSELVKLFTILFLARLLAQYQNSKDSTPDDGWWKYLLCLIIPSVIIATENLSTCLLLLLIGLLMMMYARLSWKLLGKMIGVGVLLVGLGLAALMLVPEDPQPQNEEAVEQVGNAGKRGGIFHRALTWKHRIQSYTEGASSEYDENYRITDKSLQEDRAKIAVANGKWGGLGIGNSIQRDYLPLAYADFIFAIIVEELGLWSLLVVVAYLIFMYRCGVLVKSHCNSITQSLVVLGLSSMIMIQAYISIFISLGLFPVSGQPLPLYSRGGTSILITSLYFGIILCVSRTSTEQTPDKKRELAKNGNSTEPSVARKNETIS